MSRNHHRNTGILIQLAVRRLFGIEWFAFLAAASIATVLAVVSTGKFLQHERIDPRSYEIDWAHDQLGQLAHAIPRQMTEQKWVTAYALISRDHQADLFDALPSGLQKEGNVIAVGYSMSVQLKGAPPDAFHIDPLIEGAQLIPRNDFAKWEWTIVPKKAGTHLLILIVTLIVKDEFGNREQSSLEVFRELIDVEVRPLPIRVAGFFGENWGWIITTLIALFGAVIGYKQYRLARAARRAERAAGNSLSDQEATAPATETPTASEEGQTDGSVKVE